MSWFDSLRTCTWRDVPCLWDGTDATIGRRTAVHEYPQRDLPYIEDLGRQARKFTIELIVAGPQYQSLRDRLITAIEAPGPGTLVHPTLGEMTVSVIEARGPRESTREGGMARFSVTFAESGERLFPASETDTGHRVDAAADTAEQRLSDQTAQQLDVDGRPGWVAADAIAQITDFSGRLTQTIRRMPEAARATALARQAVDLAQGAADLIRAPIDLAQAIQEIWSGIVTTVERPLLAFSAVQAYFGYAGTGGDIPLSTPSRRVQAANRQALTYHVSTSATVAAARIASRATYDSQQSADTVRRAVCDQIDRASYDADDPLYQTLSDLFAAIVADAAQRTDLPAVVRVTLPAQVPALVLAHRLYGDAGRADEIVSRNRLRHPSFTPAGRPLEVLDA